MRRVATELGTGAASLYRYLDTREDLLDLMIDAAGAEYVLGTTDDWLTGLLDVGEQARAMMRRHSWLAPLVITRPVLGPNGLALLEYVLEILAPHPASTGAKLEAFAFLTAIAAMVVQHEQGGGSARQQRNAVYLHHVLAAGRHPRLAELLSGQAGVVTDPPDPFRDILARMLTGLLGPLPTGTAAGPGAW
jgi:AcrR family transcriptional regulator